MEAKTTPRNPDSRGFLLKRMSERHKLLALSLVVGVLSGLSAVALDWFIHFLKNLLESGFEGSYHFGYLVLPGIGMLVSLLLLSYFIKDNIGHGVTKVLVAMSRNESRIESHNMWSSILTSSITIGFGGSVGAEAPIVYTGAAIGSNLGRVSGLSYKNITVLLGCGAAGAVAGIFKAPLAGVLFTMEILLFNISMSNMLPLLIATVSSTVISYIFRGQDPIFGCTLSEFSMHNIPFYLVLGIVSGFGSLYFTNLTIKLEDILGKLGNRFLRWGICAALLGTMIFLLPPLYGEGYESLEPMLNGQDVTAGVNSVFSFLFDSGWGVPVFFALVFLAKVFAMTLTNSGGGVGGTFGPTLFSGAILGFIVARSLNLVLSSSPVTVPEQNFVLVGMAGMMAGVMQAPMTSIFLIAEISGGYQLFIPLILTSAVSFGTVRIFDNYSIYTKRIASSGDLLTHDNDRSALTLMKITSLIRDKYPRVSPDDTLRKLVGIVMNSSAAVVAVIGEGDLFEGYVDVDAGRNILFHTEEYDTMHVYNLMQQPAVLLHDTDKMDYVMSAFEKSGAWRLPVVDGEGRYLGFVSRSRMLMAYRDELKILSQD